MEEKHDDLNISNTDTLKVMDARINDLLLSKAKLLRDTENKQKDVLVTLKAEAFDKIRKLLSTEDEIYGTPIEWLEDAHYKLSYVYNVIKELEKKED